ncbi:MAG: N-acetylmuramoyl-L-alanine amidase [Bacteroidetes bacterium]|nr:N-acetylmuramoyl-L-alanine amidase [Bacteroidota bacterium]
MRSVQLRRKSTNPGVYKIKKVVLDAGHGGKDPGCAGASSREKDNALAIVLRLGALIQQNYPAVEVIYTRDSDVFVELNERAAIANRNNADLFISVHCNSIPSSKVSGAETYVLGMHRAAHNLEVAKRENAVISLEDNYLKNYGGYDPNSPEAHILSSVWQSAYLEQSILFASEVQKYAAEVAEREDKGVKQAGFLVLRETAMPAVLVETGYLTNRLEDAFLGSEAGQDAMALAIFQAFEAYKEKMEGGGGAKLVSQNTQHSGNTTQVRTLAAGNPKQPASTHAPTGHTSTKNGFEILLMSWPKRLDPNAGQLSLIGDVREVLKEGKYHYYTGQFATKPEADKMLLEVKNLGFKTAAIVPVSSSK